MQSLFHNYLTVVKGGKMQCLLAGAVQFKSSEMCRPGYSELATSSPTNQVLRWISKAEHQLFQRLRESGNDKALVFVTHRLTI
jgi:hypothetical protein